MIHRLKENEKKIYVEMAKEFYHSDAVLHPIPEEHFVRTVEEALDSEAYVGIYLLESEGETAGYGLTAKTFSQEAGGIVIWIEEIYIREKYRSKGLGREFFEFLETKYKDSAVRFRLEAEPDNRRAMSLYEKLGYKKLDYIQMVRDK